MSILLTGGLGFIGSHTAVELLDSGKNIVIVDDLSNSRRDVLNRIETITGANIPFYEADICDKYHLNKIFDENAIDSVIHFAGFKAVGESVKYPLKYYHNNLCGAITLLETMLQHEVTRLIFSSSATVYGTPVSVPLTEEAACGACSNTYGRTKHVIEEMLMDLAASRADLSFVLLRYFNPIGAHKSGLIGEEPDGIPNNLMPYISQVAVGKLPKLNIFGNDYPTHDGTGVRDYIHVTDLSKGHVAAIDYAMNNCGLQIFNLGTGIGYSVLDIVTAFEKVTGIPVPYDIAPRRPGDIAECWSDPGKAERIMGWRAKLGIEDMCADSWRWQKNSSNGQ